MTTTALRPLRDYQHAAITNTLRLATAGFRGYYSLPTGTGKTRVITGLVEHYSRLGRVLVIAHRTELIEQAAQALRDDIPGLDVGVCMAERNDIWSDVIVGSIQTLQSKRLDQLFFSEGNLFTALTPVTPFSLVMFDECHHATSENSYSALISQVAAAYPDCRFLGCTATPFRSDKSSMADALPVCTFTRSIPEMIDAGWLCDVVWKPIKLPLSLEQVKVSVSQEGKDYNAAEVTALYSPQSAYIAEKVKSMVENRPTVVFAASVEHAHQLAKAFRAADMFAVSIEADTPKELRKSLLHDWKLGLIQVVINVGILTEGFDYTPIAPFNEGLAAVVVARPTMSPSLYLQMIGRGTRLKPGQYKDCLVIDICGNANLLATKQILLPKAMPTVSDEEIDEFNEVPQEESRKKAKKKGIRDSTPYSVRINDAGTASWLAWGIKDGVYYAEVGQGVTAVLLPDPTGSGLFFARIITRASDYQFTWRAVVDPAIPLAECMQHVNHLVAASGNRKLLDKDALWRVGPASEKQLQVLNKKTRVAAVELGWNKGEVGLAITWQFVRPYAEKLQKFLKEEIAI